MEMIGTMGGEEMAHTVADLEAMRDELVAKGVDAKVHKFTKLADGKVPSGLPPMPEAAVLVIKRHDAIVTKERRRHHREGAVEDPDRHRGDDGPWQAPRDHE